MGLTFTPPILTITWYILGIHNDWFFLLREKKVTKNGLTLPLPGCLL